MSRRKGLTRNRNRVTVQVSWITKTERETMEKYQEMVGKRCRLTTTGEEVWVLGLFYTDGMTHPYRFHIDDGETRGREVSVHLVELA